MTSQRQRTTRLISQVSSIQIKRTFSVSNKSYQVRILEAFYDFSHKILEPNADIHDGAFPNIAGELAPVSKRRRCRDKQAVSVFQQHVIDDNNRHMSTDRVHFYDGLASI